MDNFGPAEILDYFKQFPNRDPKKAADTRQYLIDLVLGKSKKEKASDSTAVAKGDSLFAQLLPALLDSSTGAQYTPENGRQREIANALFQSGDTGDRLRKRATGTPYPSSMQMRPLENLLDAYFGVKDGGIKEDLHRNLSKWSNDYNYGSARPFRDTSY
tara:strand:- start:41 stop:517 length:477 start_codon:yes stop_codon:yes gene_type:complete